MKHRHFRFIWVYLVSLGGQCLCHGQLFTNSLYPDAVRREVDLMQSLFLVTNNAFDAAICRSVESSELRSFNVTYVQVSFVFYYPSVKDVAPSACELGRLEALKCEKGAISRVDTSTNEIPVNYIRLWDPNKANVTAEIDLLLKVARDASQTNQYFRRVRHFSFIDGWKSNSTR